MPFPQAHFGRDSSRWDALTNLGVALVALGELAEAETCYRQALALNAGNPEAHYDLAWLLLLSGRWPEGWPEYEWRWEMPTGSAHDVGHFAAPLWDGSRVPGHPSDPRRAGHGRRHPVRALCPARSAAMQAARHRGPRVPLLALFRCAVDKGLLPGEVLAYGEPLPHFASAGALHEGPAAACSARPRATRSRLGRTTLPRRTIRAPNCGCRFATNAASGLVWAGSPANRIDRQRSMPPELLRPF